MWLIRESIMRSDEDVTRKPKIMILICALTIGCLFAVSGHTVIMYFVDDGGDPSTKAGFSIGEPVKTHEPVEKIISCDLCLLSWTWSLLFTSCLLHVEIHTKNVKLAYEILGHPYRHSYPGVPQTKHYYTNIML